MIKDLNKKTINFKYQTPGKKRNTSIFVFIITRKCLKQTHNHVISGPHYIVNSTTSR